MYEINNNSSSSSSEFEEDLENACALLMAGNIKTRQWIHDVNLRRGEQGEFHNLFQELLQNDEDRFKMYCRMSKENFEYLFDLIKEDIEGQNTQFREAIGAREKLVVCLR